MSTEPKCTCYKVETLGKCALHARLKTGIDEGPELPLRGQYPMRERLPMSIDKTELDTLLDRVRDDKQDTTGKNRNAVAYDCWRMFEDLAGRYKEEFAFRDRYKAQSNAWRDKALTLAGLLSEVVAFDSSACAFPYDGTEPFAEKHADLFERIRAEINPPIFK